MALSPFGLFGILRGFVAPAVPAVRCLTCKQLDPRKVAHELDDPVADFGRLFAMPPARRFDYLSDALAYAVRVALRSEEAELRVALHPPAQTSEHPPPPGQPRGPGFLFPFTAAKN